MTAMLTRLKRDQAGSPAVDMALILPILILLTVGVMQLGIAFLANAGLRAGVEAGARSATVITDPTSKAYPTDASIWANVTLHLFGVSPFNTATSTSNPTECGTNTGTKYAGTVSGTTDSYKFVICHGTNSSSQNFVDVTGTYPVRLNLVVMTTPVLNLSYTRRVYQL